MLINKLPFRKLILVYQERRNRSIYRTFKFYQKKCKLSVWLCQIAKNLYYDYFSKHKKMKQIEYSMSDDYIVNELFEDDLIICHIFNITWQ